MDKNKREQDDLDGMMCGLCSVEGLKRAAVKIHTSADPTDFSDAARVPIALCDEHLSDVLDVEAARGARAWTM